jgi:hypothetical protein
LKTAKGAAPQTELSLLRAALLMRISFGWE